MNKRLQVIVLVGVVSFLFVGLFFLFSKTKLFSGVTFSVKSFMQGGINSSVLSPSPTVTPFTIAETTFELETTVTPEITATIEVPTSTPTQPITSTPQSTVAPTKPKATATPSPSPTAQPTATPTATPAPTIDYSKPWTVAPGCPSTTLACVPCTSGSTCRYEPGKSHGFQGWACQNNNPGNIRNASTNMATDFKNGIITRNGGTAACGVRYDSRGGSYFVFSSYSAGYGALKAYIKGINNGEHSSYTNCGNCTIAFFFSKYAPNDSTYASYVASYIGLTPEHTLRNVIDGNKLDGFVDAIKNHEGFSVQ